MGFNTLPGNPFPPSSEQENGTPYTLPIAGADTLGGVMVGEGLEINTETGVLSNQNPTPYTLPIAGAETLGGVMVGNGLSVNAETGELTNDNPTPYAPPAYSTSEVNTGVKWIDGKYIYRKVIEFGALPNATSKIVNSGLANVNAINVYGFASRANDGTCFPLPYCVIDSIQYQISLVFNNTDGDISVAAGNDRSGFNAIIVLEYTKTTPTP